MLYLLLLLSFWCKTFFIHNSFYGLNMPSQAILVWSDFLWAWSTPKPASPPPLVFRHPEEPGARNDLKWSRMWQYLTSFILDSKASSAGNDSAFVRWGKVYNRHMPKWMRECVNLVQESARHSEMTRALNARQMRFNCAWILCQNPRVI